MTELYRLSDLLKEIDALPIHGSTKRKMTTLTEKIYKGATTDQALSEMAASGIYSKALLQYFTNTGLPPVPLRKNFCTKKLPSPAYLLFSAAKEPLSAAYIRST